MAVTGEQRSLGELFGDLTSDMKTLVKQEVRLAKAEIGQKVSDLSKDMLMLGAGISVLYAAFLALLAGIVGLVAHAAEIPWWGSGLLVGVLCLAIGGGLVYAGIQAMKQRDLTPEQTLTTLKEDATWLKEQVTTT